MASVAVPERLARRRGRQVETYHGESCPRIRAALAYAALDRCQLIEARLIWEGFAALRGGSWQRA